MKGSEDLISGVEGVHQQLRLLKDPDSISQEVAYSMLCSFITFDPERIANNICMSPLLPKPKPPQQEMHGQVAVSIFNQILFVVLSQQDLNTNIPILLQDIQQMMYLAKHENKKILPYKKEIMIAGSIVQIVVSPLTVYYFALFHLEVPQQNRYKQELTKLLQDISAGDVDNPTSQDPIYSSLILLIQSSRSLQTNTKANIVNQLLDTNPELRTNPNIVKGGFGIEFNQTIANCTHPNEALEQLPSAIKICKENIRASLSQIPDNDPKKVDLMLSLYTSLINTCIAFIISQINILNQFNQTLESTQTIDLAYEFVCELLFQLSEDGHRNYLNATYGPPYFPMSTLPNRRSILSQIEIGLLHTQNRRWDSVNKVSYGPIYPQIELSLLQMKSYLDQFYYGGDSGGGDVPVTPSPKPSPVMT